MKKIVLISCASKKEKTKTKAKDLYIGTLFKYSLAYAKQLNPDRIYILSAEYGLVDLEQEIEPYDVTLNYISPKEREKKPGLKVLSKNEIMKWGVKVISDLRTVSDIKTDHFIILAGNDYIKPLQTELRNIENPFIENGKNMNRGKRVKFLINKLK